MGRGPNVRDVFGDAPRAPRAQNHRQKNDDLGRFLKVTPVTFEGEYDPETASRWLKEVMRIFRLTVVPESFQVECSTYLLRSSALKWWEL